MITRDNLTHGQVMDLASEAAQAGDTSLFDDCQALMRSWHDTIQLIGDTHGAALDRVLAALNNAAAQG
jgi:hypothetical protein